LRLRHGQHVLVVSAAFRRRSLLLAWIVLPHTGASALADQQQVLTTALAVPPDRMRETVHGDSEFRSQTLYQWLREQGCDVMLGIRGDTQCRPQPHRMSGGDGGSPYGRPLSAPRGCDRGPDGTSERDRLVDEGCGWQAPPVRGDDQSARPLADVCSAGVVT